MYYDALVAKVTAWGRDRAEAIRRMSRALGEFQIVGVATNIPFHIQVMASDAFCRGELSTQFLEEHAPVARGPAPAAREAALTAAALLARGLPGGPRPPAEHNGAAAGHNGAGGGWKAAGREGMMRGGDGRSGWRRSWR